MTTIIVEVKDMPFDDKNYVYYQTLKLAKELKVDFIFKGMFDDKVKKE